MFSYWGRQSSNSVSIKTEYYLSDVLKPVPQTAFGNCIVIGHKKNGDPIFHKPSSTPGERSQRSSIRASSAIGMWSSAAKKEAGSRRRFPKPTSPEIPALPGRLSPPKALLKWAGLPDIRFYDLCHIMSRLGSNFLNQLLCKLCVLHSGSVIN